MSSNFWPKGGSPGILHHYTEALTTFEYTSTTTAKPNSLLFVGGLGDGLATTEYMSDIVRALGPTEWSLFSLNLTSSYQSWGLGHLDRDTDEIARCVEYIKDYKRSKFGDGKVVVMGHSTGSQCVLHYLYQANPHTSIPAFDSELEHAKRPVLDGAIMQAPVSDRESILWIMKTGLGDKSPVVMREIYPSHTPITARRFLSLASPESPQSPSEDDLFNSDLSDEQLRKTFGVIKQRGLYKGRLMVLFSGADQSVPDWVDKEKLLYRWRNATDKEAKIWDDEFSGVIPGASHALSNDDQAGPRKGLIRRLLGYLQRSERV